MSEVVRRTLFESGIILIVAIIVALGTNALRSDRLKIFGTDCIRQFGVCGRTISQADTIDLEKTLALFYNKAAIFIDARSPISYAMGHIPGAVNIPNEGNYHQYEELISGFSRDSFIVVYDDGVGGSAVHDVALIFKEKGFSKVLLFSGGFTQWRNNGLPVDAGLNRGSAFMPAN
ncbi:MAG: rhodanese-like domain-containing protein [Thermodesulforhabdaceae bacterium]